MFASTQQTKIYRILDLSFYTVFLQINYVIMCNSGLAKIMSNKKNTIIGIEGDNSYRLYLL